MPVRACPVRASARSGALIAPVDALTARQVAQAIPMALDRRPVIQPGVKALLGMARQAMAMAALGPRRGMLTARRARPHRGTSPLRGLSRCLAL